MNILVHDSLSEAHLRSILATVPDAMVVIGEDGRILSFSVAAEAMFGFSESEVIGENVSILMPSPDRERHDGYIADYRETGHRNIIGVGRVTTARRRDGSTFPIELAVGEANTPQGRVFTGFIRDLTERHTTERRLHELQDELAHVARVSAVGSLAAALAHELNQPLAAIANYMDAANGLVESGDCDPGLLREAVSSATGQALRAAEIVRRLRDFIARGAAQRRPESLKKLVREASALALLGAGKNEIDMRVMLDPALDTVMADAIHVQQILFNLIRNVLEAMEHAPVRRLEIRSMPADSDMVAIEVSDSGCGIPGEAEATLFEPFRSSKSNGMGLGLSICRTLVEAQGGRIAVRRAKCGGSTFGFTLPLAAGAGPVVDLESG